MQIISELERYRRGILHRALVVDYRHLQRWYWEFRTADLHRTAVATQAEEDLIHAIIERYAIESVLDVGCGTGRWAMELATQFPSANVIGVDIAPPPVSEQAAPGFSADNYTFVQGNVLERLPFADRSFDFVHQRYLIMGIPANRWPGVVAELMRVTRPGGWIELIETEPPYGAPALNQLADWGKLLVSKRGIDFAVASQIGPLLTAAGAADVTARPLTIPVGKPGGRLGAMMVVDYLSALTAVRGPLTKAGIASEAAYDAALAQARLELDQRSLPQNVYVAYGRKP